MLKCPLFYEDLCFFFFIPCGNCNQSEFYKYLQVHKDNQFHDTRLAGTLCCVTRVLVLKKRETPKKKKKLKTSPFFLLVFGSQRRYFIEHQLFLQTCKYGLTLKYLCVQKIHSPHIFFFFFFFFFFFLVGDILLKSFSPFPQNQMRNDP